MKTIGLLLAIFFSASLAAAQSAATYVFSTTSTTYTPITGSTQLFGTAIDEGLSPATGIGFSFTYCGTAYTQFQASSNGFIYLGSGFTDPSYGNDLASATVKPVLAPLWDDLATGSTNGKVHYVLTGTSPNRKLTIEFKAMRWDLSGTENANFQIVLYETPNMIDFVYGTFGTVSNSSGGASIGINDATGGSGHFVSVTPASTPTTSTTTANNAIGSATFLTSGLVYRFTPFLTNDMQAYAFVTPSANASIQPNVNFSPQAQFRNAGSSTQSNVPVRFEILNSSGSVVYASTKNISSIASLQTTTVTFDNCSLTAQATYTMRATALLASDGNRTNDTLTANLFSNWVATGAMNTGRESHTATLLGNGKVLVTGGSNGSNSITSSELYDPSLGTWKTTGALNTGRQYHTATLLGNGKVLVTGGSNIGSNSITSSELYDPSLGTWTNTGALNTARNQHTATLLGNGKVLVTGGYNNGSYLTSSELYGEETGTALPVELTSFSGKALSGNVVLSWTTATENNNAGFDVERSSDKSLFAKVGFVKGNGTTTQSHAYAFTDNAASGKFFYRLKQTDFDGKFEYSPTIEVTAGTPKAFALSQNYPNPFNPATVISYQLPVSSQITLKVYDVLGREVVTLVNEPKAAGNYTATFDASKFSSGIYFYRLQAGSFIQTKKMVLVK
jgi:hypothetical protein